MGTMRLFRLVCNLLLVFLLPSFSALAGPVPSKEFSRWLLQQMQIYQVPGISIVVIRDYKIDWVVSYGVRNILTEQPVTDTTLFQAGSISKPVAAVAVLKAVQDGKFDLDDNINNILTEWTLPQNQFTQQRDVTVKELLSHSAGTNIPGFIGYAAGEKIPTLLEVLKGTWPSNSPAVKVIGVPGSSYTYSGGGYSVLQLALVDTYHMSFTELMSRFVLQPLSMSNSTFSQPLPSNLMDQIARPYRPQYESVPGGPHIYVDQAAAGLWTTPFDLAKFVISLQEALRGNMYQILKPEYVQLMMKPVVSNMGLGFFVNVNKYGKPSKRGRYFMHPGQNEGYRNMLIASTRDGYGAIIMTNMSPDGRLVMNGKIKDRWQFMDALVTRIADMEEWE
jgi:CubicO group peptidase (beta-lactamase class C family)